MVQLDCFCRSVEGRPAFDHIGIQRALRQVFCAFNLARLGREALDEYMPDPTPLFLRLHDPGERCEKPMLALHDVQIRFKMLREFEDYRLFFVLAQQPIVDQDARKLRANRLVQKRGNDCRIHPARQPADHAILPDSRPNLANRLLGKIAQPPGAAAAADVRNKVGKHRLAIGRVRDLRMKLQSVEWLGAMFDGRHGARIGCRQR